jgi:hypothetical protein
MERMRERGVREDRTMRVVLALAALGMLAACEQAPTYGGIASALVIMGTDKTIVDHAISMGSGKDCSTVRLERGLHYCREDEPNPEPRVHCYPTLGRVTCYSETHPLNSPSSELGDNSHNLLGAR